MRTSLKMAVTTFALVAGLAAGPALLAPSAQARPSPRISPIGPGNMMGEMMSQASPKGPGIAMGPGNSMGRMTMTAQIDRMRANHARLMQTMTSAPGGASSAK